MSAVPGRKHTRLMRWPRPLIEPLRRVSPAGAGKIWAGRWTGSILRKGPGPLALAGGWTSPVIHKTARSEGLVIERGMAWLVSNSAMAGNDLSPASAAERGNFPEGLADLLHCTGAGVLSDRCRAWSMTLVSRLASDVNCLYRSLGILYSQGSGCR